MKTRTLQQNTILFTLLNQAGITEKEQRAELVLQYTNGRTASSKGMSIGECQELIDNLQAQYGNPDIMAYRVKNQKADDMRKAMLNIGYNMRYEKRDTPELPKRPGELLKRYQSRVNVYHVNEWCKKYGYLHKGLNDYAYEELGKLIRQFEAVHESFLKSTTKF